MAFDLEALRDILRDDKLHIMLAVVKKVAVAEDRSVCRVLVSVLPEQRELVAQMSWDAVGVECGIFLLPNVGDLVLIGQAEGDKDLAYVLRRLTTKDEKIPLTAAQGHVVVKAPAGKQAWITSGSRVNISKGDQAPSENLVLGQQLKAVLSAFMQAFVDHTHIDGQGLLTQPPGNKASVSDQKSSKVDNETILSSIAYTEKGT